MALRRRSVALILASAACAPVEADHGETLHGLDPNFLRAEGALPTFGSSGEDDIWDYGQGEVLKTWRDASEALGQIVTRPSSTGWRVEAHGGVRGEWCIQKISFKTKTRTQVKPDSQHCRIVAPQMPNQELTQPPRSWAFTEDYDTSNAFAEDAREGCVLENSAGLRYIGVVCDHEFEIDSIEVIQRSEGSIAESAQVQQLQHGSWIDVGARTHLAVNVVQHVFAAAICSADVCSAPGWTRKTGSRLPKTCHRRVCSLGECCQHEDKCSAETCVKPYWGLKANADGSPCAGTTCTESHCCEKKGQCSASVCEANNTIIKKQAPLMCEGSVCTEKECCDEPICTSEVCHGGVLKDKVNNDTNLQRPTRCADTFCTAVECCVPMNFDNGLKQAPAVCEEKICTDVGRTWSDSSFGKTCAESRCEPDECCEAAAVEPFNLFSLSAGTHATVVHHKAIWGFAGLAVLTTAGTLAAVAVRRLRRSSAGAEHEAGSLLVEEEE